MPYFKLFLMQGEVSVYNINYRQPHVVLWLILSGPSELELFFLSQ